MTRKRYLVCATKRVRGDHRKGMVAFRKVAWQADGERAAAVIASELHRNGWNVTRIRETVPVTCDGRDD